MLKLVGFLISICLIILIFLRVPKESVGLSSFAAKSDFLNSSPSSVERSLNFLTSLGIFIYFGIAIQLNLVSI